MFEVKRNVLLVLCETKATNFDTSYYDYDVLLSHPTSSNLGIPPSQTNFKKTNLKTS